MLVDAHCHPYDIFQVHPDIKQFFNSNKILAASSACSLDEFLFCEEMARNVPADKARMFPCFGIHPQFFKMTSDECGMTNELIFLLDKLAAKKRIRAIGECGYDLYNNEYKATETQQEEIFNEHIEIAIRHDLPLILHVRRAMHKIFPLTKILSKCKAVVFHSWSGTLDEAQSLLRRGVNAYFSFGNTILLNHKQAIKSCALLSEERILTETDAPYQPRRGESYSFWNDLPLILNTAADLRTKAGNKIDTKELELQIEANFRKIF